MRGSTKKCLYAVGAMLVVGHSPESDLVLRQIMQGQINDFMWIINGMGLSSKRSM